MISISHQILFGDQFEKNDMSGAGSNMGYMRCIQGFGDEARGKEVIWKI
jgi:hypothetical protein